MNTAKKKHTATSDVTPSARAAALRCLGTLMINPPKITPVGTNTVEDSKGAWTVSSFDLPSGHYRAVSDWVSLPIALKTLNAETNLYLVALDTFAAQAGVKAP